MWGHLRRRDRPIYENGAVIGKKKNGEMTKKLQ